MMSESMEFGATERGFALVEWTDRYDHRCSLQKSSLASDDCIWLGVNDAEPKILASVALRMGLPTNGETTGWVPYAVPEEVSMQTRMHLTRDMVRALLPLLQHFAETGEIPDKSTETAGLPLSVTGKVDPLGVECSYCLAKPGRPCRFSKAGARMMGFRKGDPCDPHQARVDRARYEANAATPPTPAIEDVSAPFCEPHPASSAMCARGTKGCSVPHDAGEV